MNVVVEGERRILAKANTEPNPRNSYRHARDHALAVRQKWFEPVVEYV